MALTLDSTLQSAQDGNSHHPIIELVSSSYQEDIPFDGEKFNSLSEDEATPGLIAHSSGAMVLIFTRGRELRLMVTDVARTQWTETLLIQEVSYSMQGASVCELANGDLGIVYARKLSSTDLRRLVVSISGEIVTVAANIVTYASTLWVADPFVVRLTDDSFLLAYSHENADDEYSVMLRTSADFLTWASETALDTGVLTTRRKGHPSICSTPQGDLFLLYDYVTSVRDDGAELINIYYQSSPDNGETWAVPVQLTTYTKYGEVGIHPYMAVRSLSQTIEIAYTNELNVLHLDKDSNGWQNSAGAWCESGKLYGTDFHFSPSSGKLYVKSIYTYAGDKALCSIIVLDVATWEIERCYTTATTPAFNGKFVDDHVWWHRHTDTGDGVAAAVIATNGNTAMFVDHPNEIIKTFQFNADDVTYAITKNVQIDFGGGTGTPCIQASHYDSSTGRLYILWINSNLYTHKFWIGFLLPLGEPDAITGMYVWTSVAESNLLPETALVSLKTMLIVPEMDYVILAFDTGNTSSWKGRLLVMQLSSGAIVKDYNVNDFSGFHYRGCSYPCHYNGHIYASITYTTLYGQSERKGLMDINLADDSIRYVVPSYRTTDDYKLEMKKPTGDGRIIIGTLEDGVVIYDICTGAWIRYNNASLPGLTPTGEDCLPTVDYDPVNGIVFAGNYYGTFHVWTGVCAFSIYGDFDQPQLITGEKVGSTWEFSTPIALVRDHFDGECAVASDDTDSLWVVWVHSDTDEDSLKWDKEGLTTDITQYLLRGREVKLEWSVDSPSKLSFSLASGHLFDPHNSMSILSPVLKKGRRITARMGERISGQNYFENQGTFFVSELSLSYRRGDYPVLSVMCEDVQRIWAEGKITATEYYDDADPEDVITDLITTHGGLTSEQITLPAIPSTHKLYHQWLDQSLSEMLQNIADHFGYFSVINMDGKYTIRPVNIMAATAHAYSDLTSIINFTPDDAYSDYINRVVVRGEGNYFLEVLYDEESVATFSGTIGWWGEKKTKRLWYSTDHMRTCRDPRMEIVQSVRDFSGFLYLFSQGREYLSDIDPEEKWVEIVIEAPNMIAAFLASVAAVIATGALAINCVFNCGWYIFALSISMSLLSYILGCIATYSYNIWARPIGHEKQTFQAEANDWDLQRQLGGQLVSKELDDPFCYLVQECQRVADHELSIVMAQRQRVQFQKTAHLQDEIGDVLEVPHPYSRNALRIFVTELSRSYSMPDENNSDGGMFDTITGWRLS